MWESLTLAIAAAAGWAARSGQPGKLQAPNIVFPVFLQFEHVVPGLGVSRNGQPGRLQAPNAVLPVFVQFEHVVPGLGVSALSLMTFMTTVVSDS